MKNSAEKSTPAKLARRIAKHEPCLKVQVRPDFILAHQGSLFTLKAVTTPGERWMDEFLPVNNPETQFWGGAIVIEPRYISDVLFGIQNDGLLIGGV